MDHEDATFVGSPTPGPLPTPKQIRVIHQQNAPSRQLFELVHGHCQVVWQIAQQLLSARPQPVDPALVQVGCLIHDLGVYRLVLPSGEMDSANYLRHGILGAQLLADLGYPPELGRFCSHHIGTGLSRQEIIARQLPIPPADYFPTTVAERLVAYADKFHQKSTPPRFVSIASYLARTKDRGPEKAAQFTALRAEFGDPELEALAELLNQQIA
jgi:uncharacterized protein